MGAGGDHAALLHIGDLVRSLEQERTHGEHDSASPPERVPWN